MNYIKILLFITVVLFGIKTKAQDYQFIAKIDTVAKMATVDNFGNVFVVTPKNELLKFNSKGHFLWNYTNKTYGEISQLDVTDPLRVILYYSNYQQIIVLNNNLSEINKYSFNRNPDVQITLAASANNNGFWVYDQVNRELRKLSNNFVDDLRSGNIYQRNGFDMQANMILTDDQYVYLNDTIAGVRIFDRFGNFLKTAVIYPKKGFEVIGSSIYFFEEDRLKTYDYLTFKLTEITIPENKGMTNAILRDKRLLVLTEKDLLLWAVIQK